MTIEIMMGSTTRIIDMLKTKLFEIRDRATFIPCIGIWIDTRDSDVNAEFYLIRRAGYDEAYPLLLLTRLDGGGKAQYDAYDWGDRTMQVAHDYIQNHWDELQSGDVVDVEFILGETTTPKESESVTVIE
jgi:hypothetical protein